MQQLLTTTDALGQPSQTWIDLLFIWADITYMSGLTAIKANADTSITRASIKIRYRPISAGQRIRHGATLFAIQAVLPDAKKVYTDLVCESITT